MLKALILKFCGKAEKKVDHVPEPEYHTEPKYHILEQVFLNGQMEYIVRRHMEGGYYFRYHSFGTEIEAKKYIDERLGMEVKSTRVINYP